MDYDFGSDFDLGSFEDLAAVDSLDLSGLEGLDLSKIAELGIGDFDLSGLEDIDPNLLEDLDLSKIAELGIGDFDLSQPEGGGGEFKTRSLFGGGGGGGDNEGFGTDADLQKMLDRQINGFGTDADLQKMFASPVNGLDLDTPSSGSPLGSRESGYSPEDQKGLDDLINDRIMKYSGGESEGEEGIPFKESASNYRQPSAAERAAEQARYERFLSGQDAGLELGAGTGAQEMQITPQNQESFDKNLADIMQNRGGFTSQWQKVGSDRVMVNDDGTGIGINENGDSYPLSAGQVNSMIKNGQLNTFASGYNTATGGNEKAPGGSGNKSGKDGKDGKDTAGNKSGTGEKKDDWMKWIMMLMALDAMRNKGGSSGAVIPSLTASRGTTPYAEAQKAPGYRPGQGGVQYFGPTVYRAAGGGIGALDAAGGRLLRGPGDGVSDDIVAQIGDNQPARLADGEYVLDARTVSEIGNGSTDAGADKIAQMVERIHSERRNAKRGEPSNADKKLLA
jgi:hypothetical protein